MPELPEVETVRAGLATLLMQHPRINAVTVHRRDLRRPIPCGIEKRLRQQRITGIERRGKYLLWICERHALLNHLGMTGSWRLLTPGDERRHDHVLLHLDDERTLVYNDPRRFGLLDCLTHDTLHTDPSLTALGPEPLNPESFTSDYLYECCQRRTAAIKIVIMDSSVVVGVGNIYAAEALFRAGIRPHTPAKRISRPVLGRLIEHIRAVLSEAIAAGGSTIKDFRQAGGSSGYFQHHFAVYGRGGEACHACSSTLRSDIIGQRSSVWCPRCQR